MITTLLFYFFASFAILSGLMVILSKNPIHSVLFLILVFVNSSGLLILLNVEFLAMLFLIVYVGAIAILFLFVVMMLNLKSLDEALSRYLPMGGFLGAIFLSEGFYLISSDLVSAKTPEPLFIWESKLAEISHIQALGNVLYTTYFDIFLIAGMILLVSMIGAIVLTLHQRGNAQI